MCRLFNRDHVRPFRAEKCWAIDPGPGRCPGLIYGRACSAPVLANGALGKSRFYNLRAPSLTLRARNDVAALRLPEPEIAYRILDRRQAAGVGGKNNEEHSQSQVQSQPDPFRHKLALTGNPKILPRNVPVPRPKQFYGITRSLSPGKRCFLPRLMS